MILIIVMAGLYVLGTRLAGLIYDNDRMTAEQLIASGQVKEGEVFMPHRVAAVYCWPYWALKSFFVKNDSLND